MKVLLATGNHDLDKELESALSGIGITIAVPVYYREALKLEMVLDGVEAVIISPALSGSIPVNEAILSLRKNDIRVIFLAGSGSGKLREVAIGMGVYDIIDDPVRVADVVESVLRPATFASAVGCRHHAAPTVPERQAKDMPPGGSIVGQRDADKSKLEDGAEVMVENDQLVDEEQGREEVEEQNPQDVMGELLESRELHDAGNKKPDRQAEEEADAQKYFPFRAAKAAPEKSNMLYLPHQLVAVWSPDGWAKSYTALNLAAVAAAKGFDTALINYDLSCPELDAWFGIKQTGLKEFDEMGAGVMTFEDGFKPELAACCLRKRAWGIRYLPAGNRLGYIGVPNIDADARGRHCKSSTREPPGGNLLSPLLMPDEVMNLRQQWPPCGKRR